MGEVLSGFFTIWVVIGSGWLLAHVRILEPSHQRVLASLTFHLGSPALLFTLVVRADLAKLFAHTLWITMSATLAVALLQAVLARVLFHQSRAETVLGTAAASYVNSANLGIPIAAFVLKDVTWTVPLLLFQVVMLQPIILPLLALDAARREGRRLGWRTNLTLPVRNPMTAATVLGLILNLTGVHPPTVVMAPIGLLGDLAVPTMLIAFGLSLRTGPLPGRGGHRGETVVITVLKLVIHPIIAWLLASWWGLDQDLTLVVVVLAGLPTAQNVFVLGVQYQQGLAMVRDSVFWTTILSLITITLFAGLITG